MRIRLWPLPIVLLAAFSVHEQFQLIAQTRDSIHSILMRCQMLMLNSQQLPIAEIFDATSAWEYASIEECKALRIHPNMLAYHEPTATLALIVKRSATGTDFALSEAGLDLLLAKLELGALRGGEPVKNATIVRADFDPQPKNNHRALRVISHGTAQEARELLAGIPSTPGNYGRYWWLSEGGGGKFS